MDLKKYIEAHQIVYGDLGAFAAEQSIRALRLVYPERQGELVPLRLNPVASYGNKKGLSGSDGYTSKILSNGLTLAFHEKFWANNAAELKSEIANTIVHEYIHRMTGAKHDSKEWASECQRIFNLANIEVTVSPWKKLTLQSGERKGGCEAGSLGYEWLVSFPDPIKESLLDRIENNAPRIKMPKTVKVKNDKGEQEDIPVISILETTTKGRGRPATQPTNMEKMEVKPCK